MSLNKSLLALAVALALTACSKPAEEAPAADAMAPAADAAATDAAAAPADAAAAPAEAPAAEEAPAQ